MAHTVTRLPRGADAQVGFAVETTHGTAVPVDQFIRHIPPMGFKPRIGRFESGAFNPGLITRASAGDIMYNDGGEGSLPVELTRKGMLKLLRWAIGGTPTSTVQGATTAYLHAFEPGSMQAAGSSLTMQGSYVTAAGVIEPLTLAGCKCASFELSGDAGGPVLGSFALDAQTYDHATDLATYVGPTEHVPFFWTNTAVVKRAGTVLAAVRDWKLSVNNNLKTDGRYVDGTGKRVQPIEAGYREATLELGVDLSDLSLTFDDMVADTGRAWVVEYVGAIIASTYPYTLRITIPDGHIVTDPPDGAPADGPSPQTLTIQARSNGTDAPFKVEVIETATTV